MTNASLKQLSESLAQKRLSSLELTQDCLTRIDRLNAGLNAFITVDADRSLAMARDADQRIARGEATRMTGIPVAQKNILVGHRNASHPGGPQGYFSDQGLVDNLRIEDAVQFCRAL